MTKADLSHLIASRICHDLINPIGAIHNGLELMTLAQSTATGLEFGLVQASATDARARVEFFRLAFGGQKRGVQMDGNALCTICAPLFSAPRYRITWSIPTSIDRTDAQIIVLGLLCFEKQMPHGGDIWVSLSEIRAQPKSPRDVIAQWAHLNAPEPLDPPAASDIQFAVLPRLAAEMGITAALDQKDDVFTLTLRRE